jgi:diguanylate cyclase (GGDEF)-like protein
MNLFFEKLIQAVPGVVYQFRIAPDGGWSFPYVSDGVRELFECSPEAPRADPSVLTDCVLEVDRARHLHSIAQAMDDFVPWINEFRIRTPSGAIKWVRGHAQPERLGDGSVLWSGILVDISETKAVQTHLLRLQKLYAAVIEANRLISGSPDQKALFGGICQIAVELGGMKMAWIGVPNQTTRQLDPVARCGEGSEILDQSDFYARFDIAEGRGQAATAFAESRTLLNQDFLCNPSTRRWRDLALDYGFGSSASFPIREIDQPLAVLTVYRADRNGFDDESVALLERLSSDVSHALTALSRVKERQQMEAEIWHLAYFDSLTNLPNRRMLLDRLDQALLRARRYQSVLAILFLDLDNFKTINDSLGHDVGDDLLKAVAVRLSACIRTRDTVSRHGGDEFIILLPEIAHPGDAARVAEKIIATLNAPIPMGDRTLTVSTSIGIAVYPINGAATVQELLKKADSAMYAAKDAGRNTYRFFTE